MALRTTIDFSNVYNLQNKDGSFNKASFETELQGSEYVKILIKISETEHEVLPNVYNLAFGPLGKNGRIDDKVELPHADYSKVFSTILFQARSYLFANPAHYLGIDGSNNARAYLYYRFIIRNYDYLNKHFEILGLKYYVRITRLGKTQYADPFDFSDIYMSAKKIEKYVPPNAEFMYNYFIFKLK